ncbi:MAG: radical SAM family heme chaperone HemW [Bacteroidaceae bacterium]|nr:radical SAM family heme chaperone HemW [Bacteroidaceae bacterium]
MLYIHIPFCKSRCIYCNFFSSTQLNKRKEYVKALLRQLPEKKYSTIYLGGGTPSMIEQEDLAKLLTECHKRLRDEGEFTIECNPDDMTDELATLLHSCGVNRVSLGIQTFNDARLRLINRRHSATKAREAVAILRAHDINNVSIDLMFGFPNEKIEDWKSDIIEAIALKPTHISAYCLSVEDGTQLHKMLQDGKLPALPSDEELEEQYYSLCRMLKEAGYEHYEISNFCLPGYPSRHNSGYWKDKTYDAVGAGAYGYDKENGRRYWNIADIEEYIARANAGKSTIEDEEQIDENTHYNDLITTTMRTSQGLKVGYIKENCSTKLADYFAKTAKRLEEQGLVVIKRTKNEEGKDEINVSLSPNKLFVSDDILSEFIVLA